MEELVFFACREVWVYITRAGLSQSLHPSRQALGPTQPPYNGYRDFPGGEAAEAWR